MDSKTITEIKIQINATLSPMRKFIMEYLFIFLQCDNWQFLSTLCINIEKGQKIESSHNKKFLKRQRYSSNWLISQSPTLNDCQKTIIPITNWYLY